MKSLNILLTLVPVAATAAEKPNIIFILCDDMGYGDLGCYGQPYISTPCIDSLARSGVRFTQAYAGSPVSAPSRATIMTGQHTGHTHVRGNKEYWNASNRTARYGDNLEYAVVGQEPYSTDHLILPEMMKRAGYTTGMFGKWAGGYEGSESTPDKRGVDEYYGYLCQFQAHAYFPNFLHAYSKEAGDSAVHRVTLTENIHYGMPGADDYLLRPQYSADLIHKRAIDWLDKQTDEQPFFGFFTYTLPHAELAQPSDSLLNGYIEKFTDDKTFDGQPGSYYHSVLNCHAQFAAMITRLDSYVGEIMDKLREKGLEENTIVIFSSDNGPHEEGGADPTFFNRDGLLQGIKRSCHEGGIRVPFIVRWPGYADTGTTDDSIIVFYDLMPTFMDIAGLNHEASEDINNTAATFDGRSFAPLLTGEGSWGNPEYLYWEFHETQQVAVRRGPWKLIMKDGAYHLYNLDTDLHEDHDVAALHPEIVAEMKEIIKREHRKPEVDFFDFEIPD